MKEHPDDGADLVATMTKLRDVVPAIRFHHENWDGTGYPRGQRAEETPLAARIIHVVDAYDAMTTDRPYRAGMTHEEATSILNECAGTQFDPEVVEAFSRIAPPRGKWQVETALQVTA